MSIGIYTYSNPYKLKSEKIWAQLKDSFQLCGSQTLVNGLCDFYNEDFFIGQLTTISNFIDSLYNGWMSNSLLITQLAAVDNLIESLDYNDFADFMVDEEAIISSLRKNRVSICQAIRIMFEMDMIPSNIKQEYVFWFIDINNKFFENDCCFNAIIRIMWKAIQQQINVMNL